MPDAINYDGQQLCAVPDSLGSMACLWPFLDVNVFAEGMAGPADLAEAAAQAIKAWNDVCGIRLRLVSNRSQAHIVVTTAVLDGAGRVLADSELPCGFTPNQWRPLKQRYDTGEAWVISVNPPSNRIDLARVMTHELGHAIGVGHINDGNLMAPTYSSQIRLPQRGDIAEVRGRYGLPTPTVPTLPPVNPPVPGQISGEIFLDGRKYKIEGRLIGE